MSIKPPVGVPSLFIVATESAVYCDIRSSFEPRALRET
jgi:hypothetical protein